MERAEVDSILLAQRHSRENLEKLCDEWDKLVLNAEQAGRIQTSDKMLVNGRIRALMQNNSQLWNALNPIILRAASTQLANEVKNIMASNTIIETSTEQTVPPETSAYDDDQKSTSESCQPSTSGVKEGEINLRPMTGKTEINTNEIIISSIWQGYQSNWEKLNTRKDIKPEYTRFDISGKYPRVWMLPKAHPQEVKRWFDFGALASVYTTSHSFNEIKGLPRWIQDAVYSTWSNNDQLCRGDILELYFISAAPEPAGKGDHEAFHYIRLRKPDGQALNKIKAPCGEENTLISTYSEDQISTRRAWGFWVCLSEMDKIKFPFKFFQNSSNGSFLLNTMT